MQYHIKRCSAPCVDRIAEERYQADLKNAVRVLTGKSQEVQKDLSQKMDMASQTQDYEQAALYRDQIKALTLIQSEQSIHIPNLPDVDIIAIAQQGGKTCIQAIFYRNHTHYGNLSFFPKHAADQSPEEILAAFLPQFYAKHVPAKTVLVSTTPDEKQLIEQALQIQIQSPKQGVKKTLVEVARQNAKDALSRRLSETSTVKNLLKGVAEQLDLPTIPERIEIYDNSHIQGKHCIGAMVVAGPEGFMKTAYRKFNIKSEITPGDDYGMMREVIQRRFKSLEDPESLPDLLLIDGGKGQLNAVLEVFEEKNLTFPVISIAKGADRTPGKERFFSKERGEFRLEKNDPVFHYIQRLRDEAHRFAISSHRQKRSKALKKSLLDDIPNIGAKRKQALLKHFGSAVRVKEAALGDLEKVDGISKELAKTIYHHFHEQ